jgi:hypothetical protein
VNFIEIENGITNLNFFILFITMLLYWFQSSALLGPNGFINRKRFFSNFTNYLSRLRWVGSGHFH